MTGDIRSSKPGPSRLRCSSMLARPSPRVLCWRSRWRNVWKDEEFAARHRLRVVRDGGACLVESGTSANGGREIAPEQPHHPPLYQDHLRQRLLFLAGRHTDSL